MEQLKNILNTTQAKTHSLQDENSSYLIRVTNSQALELHKTTQKFPIKKCHFCGTPLEVTGFYGKYGIPRAWITKGEYQRCKCEKAQIYWENFDKKIAEKKLLKEKAEKEKEYKENLEKLINKSNLGEKFKSRTFQTFKVGSDNKIAFEDCKKYALNFKEIKSKGTGIMLTGNYGVGKTHLVAAIAHEIIKQGFQPIYGTLINLLDKIKATYDDPTLKETEQQIINSYINCSLLIIDDLGKEKPSEWTLQKLYQIINARYEDNKPILITTNYSIEKLKDRLTVNDNFETSEAIVSRIYEMCQGINLQGEDYRKKV